MFQKMRVSLFTLSMICGALGAEPAGVLQTKDINKVMQQIFDQHVDKKEMTIAIMKNAFKVYADQFDPDRIYLTEVDVKPFLEMSDEDIRKYIELYKKGEYQEFTDLNNVIQKSITRARQIRANLMQTQASELFQKSDGIRADGYEDWSDPDLKKPYPANENELRKQIRASIEQFIAFERKRYGDANVRARQAHTLKLYDKKAKDHENQYLYIGQDDKPMSDAEKENVFAMHVLKALSNSLDAHTSILNAGEAYDMRIRLEKGVQGIGLLLQIAKDGQVVISKVLENSPAAASGQIKVNDRLVEVDGQSVANKTLDELMEMVGGKVGTTSNLVLIRTVNEGGVPVDKTIKVNLQRADIEVNEDRAKESFVKFGNGIIGTIKLDTFYQSDNGVTSEVDVANAIKRLEAQGNLRGLILDFRENSGGFLSQAIKVAGLFITNGVVVISKYFNGEEHVYRDMDAKRAYDGPLIILTSKATASAAEIVAQTLQDYGVALIVGDEHTYGKGTIQSQTVTDNKSTAYFKVTVGKYYTVSGKTPQIAGVKADVVVPSQFVHENIGEEHLENALKGDTIDPDYNDDLQDITPNLKSWYMNYYMPTLQHRNHISVEMLNKLRSNSQQRISQNRDYQDFIKKSIVKGGQRAPDDLQLAEAINVMRDAIVIEEQERSNINHTVENGAKMAPAGSP